MEIIPLYKSALKDPWAFFKTHTVKEMHILSHPDKTRKDSSFYFTEFTRLHELSLTPLVYAGKYPLLQQLKSGDLRQIYRSNDLIVKLPLVQNKSANRLVKKEIANIDFLRGSASGLSMLKYLPEIVANFSHDSKEVVVCKHDGLVTLADIKLQFPDGLQGRHIGWICKRMLSVAAFVHECGYTHGAITPEHFMINPITHGGVLVGWIHAEKHGEKIKTIPSSRRGMYPESAKNGLTPSVDICMIGRTLQEIAEPNLAKRLKNFLRGLDNCTVDAWTLADDLDAVLKDCYGSPKFTVLSDGE